jgi:signal transduction histidine kinase
MKAKADKKLRSKDGNPRRLWTRLLLAYLIPVTIITGGIGYLAYRAARVALERELAYSLESAARTAAMLVGKPRALRLSPGDENSRTYSNLTLKLGDLKKAVQAESIYLFDREERALVDSDGRFPIGERIGSLAASRSELRQVFQGRCRSSLLFTGKDGRIYKSGFAPVLIEGKVVAAVGADGSARFFEQLADLGRRLALVGIVAVALLVLVTLFVSRRITRPIDRLAVMARAIGRGELDRKVEIETNDEIGILARTLDEMRKSIRERDRQLQMMLSGIAHEVRNPLGGMALFVGILAEDLAEDSKAAQHVERIRTELDYLSRVVSDFLDFARERPLEKENIDPRQESEQLREMMTADLSGKNLSLRIDIAPAGGKLYADRERLRRVLLNLLRNAVQASAPGGEIVLAMAGNSSGFKIDITDSGSGIEQDKRDRIFEPFYTGRQQGTGLGLSLVKKIITAHGGEVSFTSEPGRGTTFSVFLPAERTSPA